MTRPTTRSLHHFKLALLALQILPIFAWANDAVKICPSEANALRSHAGTYAETGLIEKVKRTRIWNTDPYRITEIRIDNQGVVGLSYAWHEGATLHDEFPGQCLLFQGDALTIGEPAASSTNSPARAPAHFVRVAPELPQADQDVPYFDMLFKGCYRDQTRRRWCFTTHGIAIDGVSKSVRLQLDTSELPEGGSVLQVQNETLFWILKPKGDGWLVLRSDWASAEGYKPPDWSKPWFRLRPEAAK